MLLRFALRDLVIVALAASAWWGLAARSAEAGFVAFLAAGIVEWNLGDSEILALLFFLVGAAIAAGHVARLETSRKGV